MREPYTRQVRMLLEQAQAAARQMNQDFVGTEHLMLGLLDAGNTDQARAGLAQSHAAQALLRDSIDLSDLRSRVAQSLPRGAKPPIVVGDLPLSPRALRVLNVALVKAQSLRQGEVSTSALLRALLDDPTSVVCRCLKQTGVNIEALDQRLAEAGELPEE